MKMRRIACLCAVSVLAIAMCGCTILAPTPDLSRFFVLTAVADSHGSTLPASRRSKLTIGLGPIGFPAYLERPEMVTRVSPNRLELSQKNLWAEPLKRNFTTVLSADLSADLGDAQMVQYPWYATTHMDYQVKVSVDRFESTGHGNARLVARWEICAPAGVRILVSSSSNIIMPSQSAGASAKAAALSKAIAKLSAQIARALKALPGTPKETRGRQAT